MDENYFSLENNFIKLRKIDGKNSIIQNEDRIFIGSYPTNEMHADCIDLFPSICSFCLPLLVVFLFVDGILIRAFKPHQWHPQNTLILTNKYPTSSIKATVGFVLPIA